MHKNTVVKRWIFNSLSLIALLLVVLGVVLSLSIRAYYYNSVEYTLVSNIDSLETFFLFKTNQHAYSNLGGQATSASFDSLALEFVDSFEEKELMELQVVNNKGEIIVSSTGFPQPQNVKNEFDTALKSDGQAIFSHKNEAGESVMSVIRIIKNNDGSYSGALRLVTSLSQVNRQIIMLVLMIISIAVLVLLFTIIISTYFINSVLKPVAEINAAARKIALGDYNSRIEKKSEDEVGELCDTFNYMAEEISEAEMMKNDFISSISHELRTPLTAIKGWSETLAQVGPSDEEISTKGLEIISSEVERLSGIVEELLDFSRINRGHLAMKFERIDILAELTEAVNLYEDRAKREKIELVFIEPDSLPPVLGDRDRLKQVFINIIDNAIKYSDSGGKVRIETAQMGSAVQIVISDTGQGIPREELPKIKKKFYRVNRTRPGSGIGLALADEIVRRHKGRLDIDSDVGEGTAVSIMIPSVLNSAQTACNLNLPPENEGVENSFPPALPTADIPNSDDSGLS